MKARIELEQLRKDIIRVEKSIAILEDRKSDCTNVFKKNRIKSIEDAETLIQQLKAKIKTYSGKRKRIRVEIEKRLAKIES
jgi:Na+/phosphate symporter